jgi:hypothetical protein
MGIDGVKTGVDLENGLRAGGGAVDDDLPPFIPAATISCCRCRASLCTMTPGVPRSAAGVLGLDDVLGLSLAPPNLSLMDCFGAVPILILSFG